MIWIFLSLMILAATEIAIVRGDSPLTLLGPPALLAIGVALGRYMGRPETEEPPPPVEAIPDPVSRMEALRLQVTEAQLTAILLKNLRALEDEQLRAEMSDAPSLETFDFKSLSLE